MSQETLFDVAVSVINLFVGYWVNFRCEIVQVAAEIDRIVRPGGYLVVQDTMETIKKLEYIFGSLHWSTKIYQDRFLVGRKGFWRPVKPEL